MKKSNLDDIKELFKLHEMSMTTFDMFKKFQKP